MTLQRSVRASGPADLLALVPGLLGFHPEDSLVVVTVGDAAHAFHARVDLPSDRVELDGLSQHLAGVARRNGVCAVALVVYTSDSGLSEDVVGSLAGRLLAAGVDVVCAVRADGRRWWTVGDPSGTGPGTPYDVGCHPFMARTVLDGTVVHGSRKELADTLTGADAAEAEQVVRLAREATARLAGADAGPATARGSLVTEGRWVARRVRRHLADGLRLDACDVARMLAGMDLSLEVRDAAWAQMTHQNASRHVDLWRDLVRRAPGGLCAAPAALLGFAAWLSGNGALAWCGVDRALEARPGYGMAGLLADLLAAGVPPSAWRPFPPETLPWLVGPG